MKKCHRSQQIFENPTVNFNSLCNSCEKLACYPSEFTFTFLYAGSSIQNSRQQIASYISTLIVSNSHFVQPHTKKRSKENWTPDSNSSNSVTEKYHEILQSRQSSSTIFSKWTHRDFTFGGLALVQLSCSMTVHPAGSHELVDICQQTKQVTHFSLCVIINNATME